MISVIAGRFPEDIKDYALFRNTKWTNEGGDTIVCDVSSLRITLTANDTMFTAMFDGKDGEAVILTGDVHSTRQGSLHLDSRYDYSFWMEVKRIEKSTLNKNV